ncbi:MBL fold metallo-hydrolase [Sphingobium sp.]|uniref:MBL fold metallo-hydrolase n=1 Tax=Sphingobium sp. TaxID=1912891 RepID=UPI0028BF2F71|nr:MBL fold metallo-hydrolase [Sphingobium sp.]
MCEFVVDGLPKAAVGFDIPEKGYVVTEMSPGLFWVGDGVYCGMFVVHDSGVIAFDAPPAIGANYLAAIAEVTDKPITHLVYSHAHSDHIGAAHLFPKSIEIVAHAATTEYLQRKQDGRRPIPTLSIETAHHEMEIGGVTLHLDYHGINHDDGNLFMYLPGKRALMFVDVIYPGWIPFNRLGMAADVQGFMAAHDHALSYDFDHFVGGHVNRPGNREDLEIARGYVHDLHAAARNAIANMGVPPTGARPGNLNIWQISNTLFDGIVDAMIVEVAPKWRGRLGGFDDCIRENAFRMMSAMMVELPQ